MNSTEETVFKIHYESNKEKFPRNSSTLNHVITT